MMPKSLWALALFGLFAVAGLLTLPGCTTPSPSLPEGLEITVAKLSPDFHNDGVVFLGTREHGVFRSDNGGISWLAVNNGVLRQTRRVQGTPVPGPLAGVLDIAVSPSFSNDGTVFFGSYYLYRSTNRGDTWGPLTDMPFNAPMRIAISPNYSEDQTLFMRAEMATHSPETYLWRSQDGGVSWERVWDISPEWEAHESRLRIEDVPKQVQFLPDGSIVGSKNGIVSMSPDHGAHWHVLYEGEFLDSAAFSPTLFEDHIAFFGDNNPLTMKDIHRVVMDVGEVLDLGFAASYDQWSCPIQGAYGGNGCAIPVAVSPTFDNDQTAFASAFHPEDRSYSLMRSTDTGIQWEELALPSTSQVISIALSPEFAEDKTVVIVTREEMFRSQDGGDSWVQLYPPD